MVDLLFSPLGPAFILVAAGGILRALPRLQRSAVLALVGVGPLFLSMLLLVWLRLNEVPATTVAWWPLVVQPLPVRWALDGWNWLAAFLLVLTGTAALLLTWRRPGRRTGAFHGLSLVLLGAAVIAVVSGNLLALSGAWVASDILIIARARGSRPGDGDAPVGLLAASSMLFLVAIGITSLSVATASWQVTRLPDETLAILLVAAALRMAAYPAHLWLGPGGVIRDRGTQLLISGVGLVSGAWLLGRLYGLGAATWLHSPVWAAVTGMAVLAAGIAAWAGAGQDRFAMLSSSRGSWLWLSLMLAPASFGWDVLGWAMAALVLGLMLLAVGQATTRVWRWRVPVALSAALLAGVPLTVGLAARALTPAPNLLFWLLFVMGEGLALSCVLIEWNPGLGEPATRPELAVRPEHARLNWPVLRLLVAFGLAAVPAVLWGVRPEALAGLAGFSQTPSLADLFSSMGFGQWLALLAALALSVVLARAMRQAEAQPPAWQVARDRLARAAGLQWVLAAARWTFSWLETAWRLVVAIPEGEGYLGWLALLALLAWLIVRA